MTARAKLDRALRLGPLPPGPGGRTPPLRLRRLLRGRGRDAAELTFQGYLEAGADGVPNLDFTGTTVSPDGRRLFVSGEVGNVLAIYHRDATTASVRLLQAEVDDVRTFSALGGIRAITASPDGRNLYAAAEDDDAIVSFIPEPDAAPLALGAMLAMGVLWTRRFSVS